MDCIHCSPLCSTHHRQIFRNERMSSPEHPNASTHCRGIENLHVYGFGCPPCVDASLASRCAEVMLTVALRDDVVTRFSPQALERLQKELRALDLEAAKQVIDPLLPSPSKEPCCPHTCCAAL